MCQADLLGLGVMVLSPEYIKSDKQADNHETVGAISLEQAEKQEEDNSTGTQEKVIEQVFLQFLLRRADDVVHKY